MIKWIRALDEAGPNLRLAEHVLESRRLALSPLAPLLLHLGSRLSRSLPARRVLPLEQVEPRLRRSTLCSLGTMDYVSRGERIRDVGFLMITWN